MKNLSTENKPDKLYRLIDSLDKPEKGFVKKFAALHIGDEANSLRLFDIYNHLKKYDKEKIEKLVQKEKFAGYLSKTKNYLYDIILKALRVYHQDKDDWKRIRVNLLDVDMLYKKGLYNDAFSLLQKIKKEALSREWNTVLIDAVNIEGKMVKTFDTSSDQYLEKMNALHEETKQYKQMDDVRQFYNDAMRELFTLICNIAKEDPSNLKKKALNIISSEKFKEYENFEGTKINLFRNFAIYQYYYICEDKENFRIEAQKHLHLLNSENTLQAFSAKLMAGYYNNLASLSINLSELNIYKKCAEGVQKIIAHMKTTDDDYVHGINSYYKLQCEYYFEIKDAKNGLEIISKIQALEVEADDAINGNKATTYYYKSAFLFFEKKYEEAIKPLNAIELFAEQQWVIHHEQIMLKILCHLSLNKIENAVYLAKKHLHYIKQNDLRFEERKIFLSLLIKNSPNAKELAKMFLKECENKNISKDKSAEICLMNLKEWAKLN